MKILKIKFAFHLCTPHSCDLLSSSISISRLVQSVQCEVLVVESCRPFLRCRQGSQSRHSSRGNYATGKVLAMLLEVHVRKKAQRLYN